MRRGEAAARMLLALQSGGLSRAPGAPPHRPPLVGASAPIEGTQIDQVRGVVEAGGCYRAPEVKDEIKTSPHSLQPPLEI